MIPYSAHGQKGMLLLESLREGGLALARGKMERLFRLLCSERTTKPKPQSASFGRKMRTAHAVARYSTSSQGFPV